MSGGSSRSTSNNTTNNVADNSNTQINDNEGLVLNLDGSEGSETTIIQSDQGSIEQAFAFGESAVDANRESLSRSLDTVDRATEGLFDFGSDALDQAFDFGSRSLSESQDFGRDVLSEAQEITGNALQVAGNAQTNAFAKIKDIADAFNRGSGVTQILVLGGVAVIGALVFFLFKRGR